jgi:hypothetical protein
MIGLRPALVAFAAAALIGAGCGGDDEGDESGEDAATTLAVPGAEEAAALQEEIADLGDEEQIARAGEAWAEPFAAGDETMCGYLHPDLGGPSSCAEYGIADPAKGSLQASFSGTTVENVDLQGDTAVAEFSNGEDVTFGQDPEGAWKVTEIPTAGG